MEHVDVFLADDGSGGKGHARAGVAGAPDPERVERTQRRRFTSECKLAILLEAEGLSRPGELGAPLRREGPLPRISLPGAQCGAWEPLGRSLAPGGERVSIPLQTKNAELRLRLSRTEAELEKARKVIEVQGSVSTFLGELVAPRGAKLAEPIER